VGGNNPNGSAGGANNTVYSTFGNASAGSGSRFGVALGGAGNNLGSQPQNNTSPDDIQAIIAANHLHAIQSGNPTAPLFPPTKFDSQAGIPPSLMPGGSNVH
jgi:hypothetical protein